MGLLSSELLLWPRFSAPADLAAVERTPLRLANTNIKPGSWWPEYRDWLAQHAGNLKPAPKTLGSHQYKANAKAPGSYVHAS